MYKLKHFLRKKVLNIRRNRHFRFCIFFLPIIDFQLLSFFPYIFTGAMLIRITIVNKIIIVNTVKILMSAVSNFKI